MTTPATAIAWPTGAYVLDLDASRIAFATRHMFGLGAVTGSFSASSAMVRISETSAVVDATIVAASFASGDPRRDTKVTSAKFLDVAAHPDITFHGDTVKPDGADWVVEGTLTVHDTTAPVQLTVSDVRSDGDALVGTATTTIDRYAFGIVAMKGIAARTLTVTITARFTRI